MARKQNPIQTIQLRISTTPAIEELLHELVQTGLYGKNPADAAERLIAEGLRKIVEEEVLLKPTQHTRPKQRPQRG